MDSDQKLDELLELTRENNEILKGLRRTQRLAFLGRILYWVLILAIAAGAYYYVQPYIGKIMSLYSSSQEAVQKMNTIGSSVGNNIDSLKALLDNFTSGTIK